MPINAKYALEVPIHLGKSDKGHAEVACSHMGTLGLGLQKLSYFCAILLNRLADSVRLSEHCNSGG